MECAPSARTGILCSVDGERRARAARRARLLSAGFSRPADDPSPKSLEAAVVSDLILAARHAPVLDRSIAVLVDLVHGSEPAPETRTWLAIAHALRAVARNDPLDRLRALEHALRAAEAAPTSPAALFNRAWLLTDVGLVREARDAWAAFLAAERDGRWRDEGRSRLAALDVADADGASVTDAVPSGTQLLPDAQHARELAADSLLPAWGEDLLLGSAERAAATLAEARALGRALAASTGETSIADAVAWIDRIVDAPGRSSLARGHAAYGRARSLFVAGKVDASVPLFREAATTFRQAGSRFDAWADLHLAVAALYRDGMAVGLLLARRSGEDGALGASYARAAGLAEARAGRYASALRHYERAFALSKQGNEYANLAACHFLIGETRLLLGETQHGLDDLLAALALLGPRHPGLMLQNVLHLAGSEASRLELHALAAAVHSEGVRVADSTGRAHDLPEAQLRLARTLLRNGERERTAAALAHADRAIPSVTDAALRARLVAEANEVRALVGLARDPAAAARDAGRAVDYYRAMTLRPRLIDALAVRADAWLAAGDYERAAADLESALAVFQTALVDVDDPLLRASLVDVALSAADRLTALQLDRVQPAHALATFDRVRSLAAAPSALHRSNAGLSRRGNPATRSGEATLVYAHLPDRIVLWAVIDDVTSAATIAAPADAVVALIDRAEAATTANDTARARPALAALYARLIAPAGLDDGITRVTIVADGALHRVPFAALVALDGSYLIDRYVLRSVATLADARAQWAAPLPDRPRALLVASAVPAPGLAPLESIGAEIDAIAPLYPVRTQLANDEATPAAFLAALPGHDVVHFAGHALGNGARPHTSQLLLAPDASGAASVRVPEIASLDLARVGLVVLAACSTADGGSGQRHGAFAGLASTFVGAGAHAVVGSLWPVDDSSTADLLAHFHRSLREGADPALALTTAQRRMLRDGPGQLATWAAFRIQQ